MEISNDSPAITLAQLRDKLKRVRDGAPCGIACYAYIRDAGEQPPVRKMLIENTAQQALCEMLCKNLGQMFQLDDDSAELYLLPASTFLTPDKRHFLCFEHEDLTDELKSLSQPSLRTAERVLAIDEMDKLTGFLFVLGHDNEVVTLYQHFYAPMLIRGKRRVILIPNDEMRFSPVQNNMLALSGNIDMLMIDGIIITNNLSLLERSFRYDEHITNKAKSVVTEIEQRELISDIEFLRSCITGANHLGNAKKLLMASLLPVMQMDRHTLANAIRQHGKLKKLYQFDDDDRFVLTSQRAAKDFIKLLNDEYLRSLVSEREYESEAKTEFVGA